MITSARDLILEFQRELNRKGAALMVDGVFGVNTARAASRFQVAFNLTSLLRPTKPSTPIAWARGELGQREVAGPNDNPRIRWYHSHSANIGSREHPDEVAWCSSFLNAAADETGFKKTDNALARSWATYGHDAGDKVAEGDIVVLKTPSSFHVTLASAPFDRTKAKTFEGLGGNQANTVKLSSFACSHIVACRKWEPKVG